MAIKRDAAWKVPAEPQYVINWNATNRSAWAELQKHLEEAIVQACALPPGYQYVSVGYREGRQATEERMGYEPKVAHSVKEAAVVYKPTIGIPEAHPSKPLHPCHHCGAEIVRGLLADTCPNGHDLTKAAAEPEPRIEECWLRTVKNKDGTRTRETHYAPVVGGEPHYSAAGHGWSVLHVTREGAIAAWREAIKR